MSYEQAMQLASRDEAFKATIYAMNTLLIHKGIYTQGPLAAVIANVATHTFAIARGRRQFLSAFGLPQLNHSSNQESRWELNL